MIGGPPLELRRETRTLGAGGPWVDADGNLAAPPADLDAVRWCLHGPAGTVALMAFRYPPGTQRRVLPRGHFAPDGFVWLPGDYRTHRPPGLLAADDSDGPPGDCDLLPGGRCIVGGYGPHAWAIVSRWAAAGFDDEVLWADLTRRYLIDLDDGVAESLRTIYALAEAAANAHTDGGDAAAKAVLAARRDELAAAVTALAVKLPELADEDWPGPL